MTEPTEASVRGRSPCLARSKLDPRPRPGRMAQQADRLRLGCAVVAEGLVRPRVADGAGDGRRGRATAYRCRWRREDRHPAVGGRDTAGARQRRTEGKVAAPQPDRRGHMVPVVQRARLWLRSRGRNDACRVQGQPLGDQRPEGVDNQRHHADWGLLLARTDWDKPKHQGLSYFVLDIHQPGVEVRPLRQMNGHALFSQVFFTDAEIPPEHLRVRGWPRLGGGNNDADARTARRGWHPDLGDGVGSASGEFL